MNQCSDHIYFPKSGSDESKMWLWLSVEEQPVRKLGTTR